MKEIIKKNPLFFAFLLPAVTDGTVTLLGQDTSYWTSRVVNEASPAYYFLLTSPWFFALGSVFWFVFWYWIFKRLKEPINLFLMFVFIAGHSWGSTSWLWQIMKRYGVYVRENQISVIGAWCVAILYFAFIAGMATYCLKVYANKDK
ncbi:hypothetical protein C4564_06190 [Candidatus Microgenomates bacterium]|nr:MAG: hypothetical protein C4564_06190 [Candidatus Microgenomates bacterium]